jgi:PEP-CTERM motif
MGKRWLGIAAALSVAVFPGFANALLVPGTSDPWLAGMPDGSSASLGDTAPAQSPVLLPGLNLGLGGFLTFAATGSVSNGPCCAFELPDGGTFTPHTTGDENGIANVTAPVNSLVGVFLDDSQPDGSLAPSTLDFSTIGLAFATLSPALKQVFFIGDGLTGTGSGTTQTFNIPLGATRLFLGTMDGFEWANNLGQFDVTIAQAPAAVPEPATLVLLGSALVAGVAASRRKLRS